MCSAFLVCAADMTLHSVKGGHKHGDVCASAALVRRTKKKERPLHPVLTQSPHRCWLLSDNQLLLLVCQHLARMAEESSGFSSACQLSLLLSWCFTSTETIRLTGDGRGEWDWTCEPRPTSLFTQLLTSDSFLIFITHFEGTGSPTAQQGRQTDFMARQEQTAVQQYH